MKNNQSVYDFRERYKHIETPNVCLRCRRFRLLGGKCVGPLNPKKPKCPFLQ